MKIGTFATKADFRRAKTIEWLEKQNKKVFTKQEVLAGFYWALRQERAIIEPHIPTSNSIMNYVSTNSETLAFYGTGRQSAYLKDSRAHKYLQTIGRDKYVIMTNVPSISKPADPIVVALPNGTPTIDYALIATQISDIDNAITNIHPENIIAEVQSLLPSIITNNILQILKNKNPDVVYPKELISLAINKLDIDVDIAINRP